MSQSSAPPSSLKTTCRFSHTLAHDTSQLSPRAIIHPEHRDGLRSHCDRIKCRPAVSHGCRQSIPEVDASVIIISDCCEYGIAFACLRPVYFASPALISFPCACVPPRLRFDDLEQAVATFAFCSDARGSEWLLLDKLNHPCLTHLFLRRSTYFKHTSLPRFYFL